MFDKEFNELCLDDFFENDSWMREVFDEEYVELIEKYRKMVEDY
ncbi:MAG TPA: hypothetical protein VGB37_05225 [Candidatus Lokiarchaeia archaeon]